MQAEIAAFGGQESETAALQLNEEDGISAITIVLCVEENNE